MRLIGTLENKIHAERFAAFMTVRNIATHLEKEGESWEVWIKDEDKIGEASTEFEKFQASPDASEYSKVVEEASALIRREQKQRQEVQRNLVQMQNRWQAGSKAGPTPLTIALIAVSVVVTLLIGFGENTDSFVYRALAFTSLTDQQAESVLNNRVRRSDDPVLRTGSIRRFELWRLITPIFIHFGPIHLLFNGYMMFHFGRQIEGRYGTPWLFFLVIVIAIPSTVASMIVPIESWQGTPVVLDNNYWVTYAGGLSGVIYGLFGYVWMKVTFDRESRFFLTPVTIAILVGWLFFCIFFGDSGIFGENTRVNNWAHGVGLVVGMMIGYFPKFITDLRGTTAANTKK